MIDVLEKTHQKTHDRVQGHQNDSSKSDDQPDVPYKIVYYSSGSGNTHKFVNMLGFPSVRISRFIKDGVPTVKEPYILVCPSYGDNTGSHSVPKQVIRFLNIAENRDMILGVIGTGNRNFGEFFAHASKIISKKCSVPVLYRFELSGTSTDLTNVKEGIKKVWHSLISQKTAKKLAV